MDALDNRCPSCGAKITFNPKNQMWDCTYCGSKFTLEEMKKYDNASNDKVNVKKDDNLKKDNEIDMKSLDIYHCKNCGAEVMADEETTATFCVYCGSTTILKEKIESGRAPSKIIPFKKVKEDAIEAFKSLKRGRPLMPKLFNNEENIKKITGVYIPFWQYDLSAKGDISFDASDVTSWSDSEYRYVKTDRYLCKRKCDLEFDGVLVDGSSRFDDDLMDSIEPFEYKDLVEYNHAYLSGFLAEKYDVSIDTAMERAVYRCSNSSISEAKRTVHHGSASVNENSLSYNKLSDKYILLPVWMVNIDYNNKKYTFAMNGQTGKLVGNIPISVGKAILITIMVFTICFIVSLLFLIGVKSL